MAEVLESYEFRRGRSAGLYPWETWLDGQIWSVKQGEDFEIPLDSMRTAVMNAAGRMGGKVRTSKIDDETLAFQFYQEGDE